MRWRLICNGSIAVTSNFDTDVFISIIIFLNATIIDTTFEPLNHQQIEK